MSVMDKFLNYMKLNEDDEYDDDGYFDGEDDYEEPAPRRSSARSSAREDREEDSLPAKKPASAPANSGASKVTPMRHSPRKVNGNGMEVCVIKPSSVEDAREITDTLLSNRTVIMNLEGLEMDVAQRILDFTSGSCYAIDGKLQKIALFIFIITPASVDISGDFQGILGNFEASSFTDSI